MNFPKVFLISLPLAWLFYCIYCFIILNEDQAYYEGPLGQTACAIFAFFAVALEWEPGLRVLFVASLSSSIVFMLLFLLYMTHDFQNRQYFLDNAGKLLLLFLSSISGVAAFVLRMTIKQMPKRCNLCEHSHLNGMVKNQPRLSVNIMGYTSANLDNDDSPEADEPPTTGVKRRFGLWNRGKGKSPPPSSEIMPRFKVKSDPGMNISTVKSDDTSFSSAIPSASATYGLTTPSSTPDSILSKDLVGKSEEGLGNKSIEKIGSDEEAKTDDETSKKTFKEM